MSQKSLPEKMVRLRRELHANPEVGLHLPNTQAAVLNALAGLPLDVSVGRQLSSVTAVLRGDKPGPAVILRADMDALPIRERTGLPYASSNGAMHACGHDLHTAALLGAADLLSQRRAELAGSVIFMFQPGEEGHDGARLMIEEGLLHITEAPIIGAYAVHVSSDEPAGIFRTRPGSVMASYDTLDVNVIGSGGHGSAPQDALDPVTVAAEITNALQILITRRFDVFNPVVLTVGQLNAGSTPNIIPATAQIRAGIRAFDPSVQQKLESELTRLAQKIAEAYGLTATVNYNRVLPATINDQAETRHWLETAKLVAGPARTAVLEHPKPVSEDFSRVLQEIPGAYGYLGAGPRDGSARYPNHSPQAVFDDAVLADQAQFMAALAVSRLRKAAAQNSAPMATSGQTKHSY